MIQPQFDLSSTSKTLNISLLRFNERSGFENLEIYINLMYVQFHTYPWTDGDPIAKSCHNKRKKHGLVSTYELNKNIKFTTPNV